METVAPNEVTSPQKTRSAGCIVLGILLLLPSLFCCISQLLIPTINTFAMSFQKVKLLGSENEYVGLNNYAHLFGSENFGKAASFTLITLAVRLLIVVLLPLVFAWATGQFGRPLRLGLRTILTVPIILFVPVAIAITWLMFLNPSTGFVPSERSWAANPTSARATLLLIDALYLLGLASGLGLIYYLPLWRRPAGAPQPTLREVLKPMLAAWALGLLGLTAWTLNTFSLNLVLTNGGPAGSTTILGNLLYNFAFRNLNLGVGAAIASVILLITLALGTIAGLLVLLTRLRLDIVDNKTKAEQSSISTRSRLFPGIVLALLGLLIPGLCLLSTLPFGWLVPQAFGQDALGGLLEQISVGGVLINTLVPALITATLQVLIAYLAALSIGALRPLGKRSEWLLLLFSPWLFITVLPLSLVAFIAHQKAHLLDSFVGLLSPISLSIPALFILTIFFSGRASRLQENPIEDLSSKNIPNFFKHFILPSLPLAMFLWLVILFFNGQDVLWPLLVGVSAKTHTLSIVLLRLAGMFKGGGSALAAAITFYVLPVCVLFFLCLAPLQIFYLDRLALYSENPSTAKTDSTPDQG